MFCNSCGAQIPDDAQFCPICGAVSAGGGSPTGGGGGGQSPPSGGTGGSGGGFSFPPIGSGAGGDFVPPANIQVKIGEWIGQGWELVKPDWLNFALIALLTMLLSGVVPIILQGPAFAGFFIVCIKRVNGQRVDLNDFFKGFNYFVPTLVATILISIFATIGFLLCIIPGLVVSAVFFFTYLFIIDKKMDFWPAMQASHAIVKTNYVQFTLLLIVFGLLHTVGILACFVGIFVTLPIQFAALTVAYKEIVGFTPGSVD